MNIDDLEICPRCHGTGADPDEARHNWQPRPTDPATGERSFALDVRCRLCSGNGRIPTDK
jgi:DnaJ-class molecular chaperone